MNAHSYLLTALLLTACYDDSNSRGSDGTGGTGTTSSISVVGSAQTSGSTGGTTAGGVTTIAASTTGGSGGDAQGGAAGGGAGGAAGGAASGAGGEGGASFECVPALYALVRSTFGDFHCPELENCFVESCPDELAAAVGEGWPSGDHTGGICATYVDCVEACACESECSRECRDEYANSGACLDAIIEVSLCRNDACPTATDSCGP